MLEKAAIEGDEAGIEPSPKRQRNGARRRVQVPMLARGDQHDRLLFGWKQTMQLVTLAGGSEREQRKNTSARLIGEGWDIKKHWVGRERSDQEPEDV
jgi:hypothetical protein